MAEKDVRAKYETSPARHQFARSNPRKAGNSRSGVKQKQSKELKRSQEASNSTNQFSTARRSMIEIHEEQALDEESQIMRASKTARTFNQTDTMA